MLRAEDRGQQTVPGLEGESHLHQGKRKLWPRLAGARKEHLYGTSEPASATATRKSCRHTVEASVLNCESLQIRRLKMPHRQEKGPERSVILGPPYGWSLPFYIQAQ